MVLNCIIIFLDVGTDYVIAKSLNFSGCEERVCVSPTIVDDDIVENEESFIVSLERTSDLDSRISLSTDTTLVTILDDGNYWYKQERWLYISTMVAENL